MKIEDIFLKDYLVELNLFLRRIIISFIFIFLFTIILITNIYYLQIIKFNNYSVKSRDNRIKLVPIAPSRGTIYDRKGISLAYNRNIYQLEILPYNMKDTTDIISKLRSIINITDEDIAEFKKKSKLYPHFSSIPLKRGLTDVQIARLAVNHYRFPEIKIKNYQHRYYPYGATLTHVIGYVSKINNIDIKRLSKDGTISNYMRNQNIGKLGIERYYEYTLHGKAGYEEIEVNNRGQIIRQLHKQFPQPGKDIILTIDLSLQQYIEKLLVGSRAAVVVIDPRDGGILALVSNPSYDPNLFVNGISEKKYTALLKDKNHPLINRATQGIYPPASTVKPYISVSALALGIINEKSSIFDPGWWQLPGSDKRYRDWQHLGHGYLNVTRALEESADTFFYQIAYNMGIDKIFEWMTKFGYGKHTGIDLFEEKIGLMPNRKWKIKYLKKPWYQGDTIPVGIGQGYWTATPLQMSKALIALINDGLIYTPHLLYGVIENTKKVSYYKTYHEQIGNPNSNYWGVTKNGMYGVANRPNGTARNNFIDAPYKAAVKSGTAQVCKIKNNKISNNYKNIEYLRDHKLMIAFAPYNKPLVGTVVILENGGVGLTAGDITRKILDFVLLHE